MTCNKKKKIEIRQKIKEHAAAPHALETRNNGFRTTMMLRCYE